MGSNHQLVIDYFDTAPPFTGNLCRWSDPSVRSCPVQVAKHARECHDDRDLLRQYVIAPAGTDEITIQTTWKLAHAVEG